MARHEIEIPDEALDLAIDAINENPEISDSDLGAKLRNRFGDPLLGDIVRAAVIPLMR
jgi:hypothetical protein